VIKSLCLLGSFRVCADPFIKTPKKSKALLALLAMAALDGGGVSRERLSTMLWPYHGSEHARHSLRNCLMELRKSLRGEAIKILITDFANCSVDIPTDVADFVRLEKSDRQQDLELAAELYRGELLDDFCITSEPFEEWLRDERDLWRARAMKVLARLSGIAHDNADHPVAIDAARRLVQIDTLNEGSQRLLIVTLDTAGQRGEAARQYQVCRKTLKEELGIDPDPETVDLAERLFAVNRSPTLKTAEVHLPVDRKDEVLLRRAMRMLDDAREEIRENLDHSASLMEALRLDRAVLAKLLLRLEQIIDSKHVGMNSLKRMRDAIKARLEDESLAPATLLHPQSNGEVGVELRA
jgi:DNA-binding SARP family transcriptional activator